MKTSEQIDQIAPALAAAQAEIKPAPKDSTNPHFKSRYADLASIWEACKGPLSKHDLAVIQAPSRTPEGLMRLTTRIIHKSGQWIESELDIRLMKDDAQAAGSAITYARRYSLAPMVGCVAEEDDDGNAATDGKQKEPYKPKEPYKAKEPHKPIEGKTEEKLLFDKENPKHIAYLMEKYEQGVIPDGAIQGVIAFMHGKAFNTTTLSLALAEVSVGK